MIVTFMDLRRAGLVATMRTYTVVALLSLCSSPGSPPGSRAGCSPRSAGCGRRPRTSSESDLSLRLPEVGNDDITALTRTFNAMLARLEAAFVGQRQFLDDAGHELKTPLTVLSGHLELLDPDDPEEVAETRELLLDETDRMARLVGDLILLAKHDRPDFLTPAAVSVERLTHSLVRQGARAGRARVGPRRGGRGHRARRRAADHPGGAPARRQRRQAHDRRRPDRDRLPGGRRPGRPLWVRDTGPGVPPELRAHVFERFGRAGVVPGDEGFGLGLSIVRAIAQSHGGSVRIDDAEPHGAVVTIELWQEPRWHAS